MKTTKFLAPIFKPDRNALILAATYTVCSSSYIYISGKVVENISVDLKQMAQIEIFKGITFMFLSGSLLYFFSRYLFRRVEKSTQQVIQSREALLSSEKRALAGMFATTVAHDCNNLLTILGLRLDKIRKSAQGSGENKNILEMQNALEAVTTLVQRLKTQGGKNISLMKKKGNLTRLLKESIRLMATHSIFQNCRVHLESPDEQIEMNMSSELMQQMIANLLMNAGEALAPENKAKKEILIRLRKTPDQVLLEVHDSGSGVPEKEKELIFEPFYTTKKSGSGLGLLSVRACVEEHNGHFVVDRSALLSGACFQIQFPV